MADSETSDSNPRWDIVVVTYNSARHLENYWKKARELSECELYAVDNGSTDDSAQLAKDFGFRVTQSANVGLARANNAGASFGRAENILFANPDVSLDDEVLRSLREALDHSPNSIVAPRLVSGEDRQIQANARQWPTLTRVIANRVMPNSSVAVRYRWPESSPDWITGACIAMKRQVFENTVRWPESYFLYYEDVQLCLDARRRGLAIRLADDILVEHAWQRESGHLLSRATLKHLRSALQFYRRNPWIALGRITP